MAPGAPPVSQLALVVGGGPAPGINGVISAVTIQGAENRGIEVLGVQDGYRWLMEGVTEHIRSLRYKDVRHIHLRGGSILGTARANPTKDERHMQNVLRCFRELGVDALVSIGGDDTAYTASQIYHKAEGQIR